MLFQYCLRRVIADGEDEDFVNEAWTRYRSSLLTYEKFFAEVCIVGHVLW